MRDRRESSGNDIRNSQTGGSPSSTSAKQGSGCRQVSQNSEQCWAKRYEQEILTSNISLTYPSQQQVMILTPTITRHNTTVVFLDRLELTQK